VTGCREVARADVDGDRRTDDVGVVQRDRAGSTGAYHVGTSTVRVRLAAGRTLLAAVPYDGWFGRTFWGAARVDGVRGADLVLGSTAGAHARFFRGLTYRAGRLVTLPSPDTIGDRRIPGFYVDGAVTVYAGVACGTDGHGAATLTISAASREGDGSAPASTFVLASASFRWDGRWVRTSQSTRAGVAERTAAAPAGFHCAGLPRF